MDDKLVDLTEYDDAFGRERPEERGDFEEVPDGKYEVTVEKVELTQAQSTGNPMIKWMLRINGPRLTNRVLWRNSVITMNTLKYVKTDLHLCGIDLEKLSNLPLPLERLLDLRLSVTKKTKGENENIFFNSRIDNGQTPNKSGQSAGDSAIPF